MRLNTMLGLAAVMALTSINLGFSIGDEDGALSGGDSTPDENAAVPAAADEGQADDSTPAPEPTDPDGDDGEDAPESPDAGDGDEEADPA